MITPHAILSPEFPGGISLSIISFGMNHQRCASAGKYGMRIIAHVRHWARHRFPGFALGVNIEIGYVTGVWAFRIMQAVFLSVRVEMRSG